MAAGLRISDELTLPVEAVTETFAILAKRGAGKTYSASVLVEEMLKAHLQVVVVDPMGAWFGLRSSADGKRPGLPIAILGGEHGDVPLELEAGELVADLVVDERLSCVLDISAFRKHERKRFVVDFAERLYHRNRNPLHLVLEEADLVAPQKPIRGEERMLGAIEDLVRRGRGRGIGVTLITQRSAVLNKDVLTQTECLIALRTTSPQDRAAIELWVSAHDDPQERREALDSLPSLPIGEAWVWSPGWLGLFKRVRIRQRETFDSSATPKAGQNRAQPKTVADVDLAALQERMAATIEKAKQDDPRELRRRIVHLERQLRESVEKGSTPAPQTVEVRVEVPAITADEIDRLRRFSQALSEAAGGIAGRVEGVTRPIIDALDRIEQATAAEGTSRGGEQHGGATAPPPPDSSRRRPEAAVRVERPRGPGRDTRGSGGIPRRGEVAAASDAGDVAAVSGPQQRILNALAQLETIGAAPADKTHLALFAEASPKSSSYTNNLGKLRTAGLIAYPQPATVELTDAGRAIADGGLAPGSVEELHAFVYRLVGGAKSRLLAQLIDVYPRALDKQELADRAGASVTSSSFTNNLGRLRSLKLIDYPQPGYVAALPVLFLEGGR